MIENFRANVLNSTELENEFTAIVERSKHVLF